MGFLKDESYYQIDKLSKNPAFFCDLELNDNERDIGPANDEKTLQKKNSIDLSRTQAVSK